MDMGDPILGEHYIIFMSLHAPYSVIGKKMLEVGDPILLEHTSFLRFHMLHVQYLAKIVRHGDPILLKHRSFLHFHIHHIQWSVKKCQTWESQILGGLHHFYIQYFRKRFMPTPVAFGHLHASRPLAGSVRSVNMFLSIFA